MTANRRGYVACRKCNRDWPFPSLSLGNEQHAREWALEHALFCALPEIITTLAPNDGGEA